MKKRKTKYPKLLGKKVYIFSYLGKAHKDELFLCRGTVISTGKAKGFFRVKIEAVADRAIGCPVSKHQAALLGRVFNKKRNEIYLEIPSLIKFGGWIEIIKS